MIAFDRGRAARGGFALGFATVSKVFPGALGVLLVVRQQWTAVAWTVAWSAAFTVAAWLMVGSTPFVDFFHYQLPRIESGQAFFWMNSRDAAPINFGVHGLIIKLRFLGVPWTGPEAASRAASLYGVLLLPVTLASRVATPSARHRNDGPRAAAAAAGAGVARSAQPGVLPQPIRAGRLRALWDVVAADARRGRRPLAGASADGARHGRRDRDARPRRRPLPDPVPTWIMVATLCIQIAAIAFNAAIVLTPGRAPLAARTPTPARADGLTTMAPVTP